MHDARPSPLRRVTFFALAAWIVLAPGLNQVLHLRVGWARSWRMYASSGANVCDVTYFRRTRAGDQPLDYVQILHRAPWWRVEPFRRRVMRDDLATVGKEVCRVAGARDVRAQAVCALPAGWKTVLERERNLCR